MVLSLTTENFIVGNLFVKESENVCVNSFMVILLPLDWLLQLLIKRLKKETVRINKMIIKMINHAPYNAITTASPEITALNENPIIDIINIVLKYFAQFEQNTLS